VVGGLVRLFGWISVWGVALPNGSISPPDAKRYLVNSPYTTPVQTSPK